MTATNIETSETVETGTDAALPWVAPAVTRLHAGKAEDGFDPFIVDGTLTKS
jgi:hypothetical protein